MRAFFITLVLAGITVAQEFDTQASVSSIQTESICVFPSMSLILTKQNNRRAIP